MNRFLLNGTFENCSARVVAILSATVLGFLLLSVCCRNRYSARPAFVRNR